MPLWNPIFGAHLWHVTYCCLQPQVDEAVKTLLALKAQFKAETGREWKPGCMPAATPPPAPAAGAAAGKLDGAELNAKVTAQGDKIRQLKSQKADKVCVYAISSMQEIISFLTGSFSQNSIDVGHG